MAETFTTTVLQAPGLKATGLPVPDHAVEGLGGSRKPAVTVRIGDYSYRTTVSTRYGGFIVPLSAEHRAALGLAAGDSVQVTLELDTAPRVVAVPDDLAAALAASPGGAEAFAALSPSRRAAFVGPIEAAKTAETRSRRIATVIDALLAR